MLVYDIFVHLLLIHNTLCFLHHPQKQGFKDRKRSLRLENNFGTKAIADGR
jgi:hypothetical protein